jgi:hypothetical protein
MSTAHQHKPAIAASTIAEAVAVAARKFEAMIDNPTSPRAKRYAQSGLAALEKFRVAQ